MLITRNGKKFFFKSNKTAHRRFIEKLFAVAEDQHNLIYFTEEAEGPIQELRLFPGELPEDLSQRKKIKPDLEALLVLPSINMLLAVPSGSKLNRCHGALIDLKSYNVIPIDFSELFSKLKLKLEVAELNIEGAIEVGDEIRFFHRGNGKNGQNKIIHLQHNIFMGELNKGLVTQNSFKDCFNCDIGHLNNVQLGFTDAFYLKEQDLTVFLAAAENTDSTYNDGDYVGAVIGCLDKNNHVVYQEELKCPFKPEGLWVDGCEILIVTDADDPTQLSCLYKGYFEYLAKLKNL